MSRSEEPRVAAGGDAVRHPPRHSELDRAIERATEHLKGKQLPSGCWLSMEDFEPRTSALHLITLKFVDRVPLVEARATARFLATLQRDDGSFPPYPYAPHGELCATALVWAALVVADLDEQRAVRERARRYVEAHGGIDAVVKALYDKGDMTALYLAMAGLCEPDVLPDLPLVHLLVPGSLDALTRVMNAGVILGFLFLASVTRHLRAQKASTSTAPPLSWLQAEEAERGIAYVEGWLNPNGNNNGTTVQTDQAIATLFALGRTPESTSVYSALQWFSKLKVWSDDHRELRLRAFTNENWMTAFALRALLHAGVGRDDDAVERGLDYLTWSQSKLPMPLCNLRRENAHRTGGWGFEEDNLILPDTDDTGIVLSALGTALDRGGVTPLDDRRDQRVRASVALALNNVLDMQSDDGGWAGFVWNLGSKGPGPLFEQPIGIPKSLFEMGKLLIAPPLEVKEVPVEGLTGRVLQGLGANGFDRNSVEVQRAAQFLRERQCADGSFWARWLVGYVAATASVVSGLADCDWDLDEVWVKRAIDWLVRKQNDDGGWGETPEAYEHPERNVQSPSMPPLTAIVVIALVDAGLVAHPAVTRAVQYLLRTQEESGAWGSNEWMQIYEPYATYYFFEGDAWTRPLEALGKVRAARQQHEPARKRALLEPLRRAPVTLAARAPGTWSPAALRRMRANGDRVADDVIGAVFADGDQQLLHQTMGALIRADEPLPTTLPAKARAYFVDTEGMPAWADRDRLRRGQQLFTQHGWMMAMGLFCSSLPQAYCAANGALVLSETHGMTRHFYRRILETAQFLFDICVEGSFDAGGRAIRSAQKVRLMHAAVRHMVLLKGEWDVDVDGGLGVPLNQEDLAGTLMTFSVVLLDALKTCGIDVDADDEAAFLHLWQVAGHFLGVDPDLVPKDVADGRALMQAIRDDQWQASPQGQELVSDLIECVDDFIPGELLDGLPAALIQFLTPPPCSTLLNVQSQPLLQLMIGAGASLNDLLGLGSHTDRMQRLVQLFAREVMIGLIDVQREGKHTAFRIPTGLVRGWNLDD